MRGLGRARVGDVRLAGLTGRCRWMGGDVGPEVDPGLGLSEDQAGRGHPVGQLGPVPVAVHDGLVADELLAVPGLLCPGQGDQLVGGSELAEEQLEQSGVAQLGGRAGRVAEPVAEGAPALVGDRVVTPVAAALLSFLGQQPGGGQPRGFGVQLGKGNDQNWPTV